MMRQILFSTVLLGILPLTACSVTTTSAGSSATTSSTSVVTTVAAGDSLPNSLCVTLRMRDNTQQLVYLRTHPAVRPQPRNTVVSAQLTSITYDSNDIVRYQSGKALTAGTSTAGLPEAAKRAGFAGEYILFFGLPDGSHITIVTDSGLQWRDQDIEGDTYALALSELPRGKYIVSLNATTFRVELK
ncbi:MAG: hypothetical protein K6G08_03420 [Prevotella sp.]|jgi:hypothetical protein|nr:hypothetical protein [Prevotella sp.]